MSAAGHHHHGRDALQQHHAAIGRHIAGTLPLAPIGSVPGGRGPRALGVPRGRGGLQHPGRHGRQRRHLKRQPVGGGPGRGVAGSRGQRRWSGGVLGVGGAAGASVSEPQPAGADLLAGTVIANNTLYGSKLSIFILCQKSLGYYYHVP